MKFKNNDPIAKAIFDEIFSHGLTIEDIFEDFDAENIVEKTIRKTLFTSYEEATDIEIFFNIYSFTKISITCFIIKKYTAGLEDLDGNEYKQPIEIAEVCSVLGHITNSDIDKALFLKHKYEPCRIWYENATTMFISRSINYYDSEDPDVFLYRLKRILKDETLYKYEIDKVNKNNIQGPVFNI